MPELPEAEVAIETGGPCLLKKKITDVLVSRPQSIRTPLLDDVAFVLALRGRKIESLERRAKALLFHFDDGSGMVFHFKLGAALRCREKHLSETSGVALNFSDGSAFEFGDLALSEFHVAPANELEHLPVLKAGADPMARSFSWRKLKEVISPNKQLKAALTDQSVIAGIGNNYSDEILWNSRLSPFRKASGLTDEEWKMLSRQMKKTLREGIKKGGEFWFTDARGRSGTYIPTVHRQPGRPCPRDGHPIEVVARGRKTFWCPECQL